MGEGVCTGSVTGSGSTAFQPAAAPGASPSGPWYPLRRYDGKGKIVYTPSQTEIQYQGGGDTDECGTDSYALIRFIAVHANMFLWAAIECEDNAKFEWSIRYKGEEKIAYTNGETLFGDNLALSNTATIDWYRRLIDFDSKNAEYDEEKEMIQNWSARCFLIDGSNIFDGTRFHRIVPGSTTSGVTVSLGVSAEIGASTQGGEASVGGALGVAFTTTSHNESWSDLEESANSSSRGPQSKTVVLSGSAPCPSSSKWFCNSHFEAKLAINDQESCSGSLGSRQELTVKILNYIHGFTVTKCWPCGYLREPTDPIPPPPTPVTPPTTGGGETVFASPVTPTSFDKRQCRYVNPNPLRDVDGDGQKDGIVFGAADPFIPDGWCGTPYYLGVGHGGPNPADGFVSIDRWQVGDYGAGDRLTGALIDPWRVADGMCALVVVKNVETGTCTLREIARGVSTGTYNEIWPDRSVPVPCVMYDTCEVASVSLSALHSTEHVSGGYLGEQEIDGVMGTVLYLCVVEEQECELADSDPLTGHITLARHVVTRNGHGELVLTEYEAD